MLKKSRMECSLRQINVTILKLHDITSLKVVGKNVQLT